MNNLNESYQAYLDNPCDATQEILTGAMLATGTAWIKSKYGRNYNRYEDIVVDTALEIWRTLRDGGCKYDATQGMSFRTWYLMDLKRNLDNEKAKEIYFVPLSPNLVAPEDHWREAKIDLERFIPTLTEKQQQVVELTLDGYTQEEIGEKLNIKQNTVCEIYTRAIDKLREKMNPTR